MTLKCLGVDTITALHYDPNILPLTYRPDFSFRAVLHDSGKTKGTLKDIVIYIYPRMPCIAREVKCGFCVHDNLAHGILIGKNLQEELPEQMRSAPSSPTACLHKRRAAEVSKLQIKHAT